MENREAEEARALDRVHAELRSFMQAALVHVDPDALQEEPVGAGVRLFFLGAARALAAGHGLEDAAFMNLAARTLHDLKLPEQEIRHFVGALQQTSQEPIAQAPVEEGARTLTLWHGGRDSNAPLRLGQLVREWQQAARS